MNSGPKISEKQYQTVTSLPGPKRYDHFVKTVVNWQRAWGLWDGGWVIAETDAGERALPLWPAQEYARRIAVGVWASAEPRGIPLHVLMKDLLPSIEEDGILPGVFFLFCLQ